MYVKVLTQSKISECKFQNVIYFNLIIYLQHYFQFSLITNIHKNHIFKFERLQFKF